jgi:hypothetical protein
MHLHAWAQCCVALCTDPNGEVGSTVVLGGKYYMLFGGGHIYSSDDPIKGYKPDPVNWAFHTDGQGVYFSRLWNVQRGSSSTNTSTGSNGVGAAGEEQVLLSHQWVTGGTHGKGIYLGPLKELKIGAVTNSFHSTDRPHSREPSKQLGVFHLICIL